MSVDQKNIFVPLKSEHYQAFETGTKKHELRAYGKRWNEKNCAVGRGITLSKGYGKKHRMHRTVVSFEKVHVSELSPIDRWDFLSCYYGEEFVARIGVSDE